MKSRLLALPLAMLIAVPAFAAQRIDHTVTVTATVPVESFYVEPLGGNWMNDPQNMSYRPVDGALEPIRKQLSVKSTSGAITAKLMNTPTMSNGTANIPLTVAIAGKALNTAAAGVEIATIADAKNGTVVDFTVAAVKNSTPYAAGTYQGMVNLIFETADIP